MKYMDKELEVFMKELEELEDMICLGSGGTLCCCKGKPKESPVSTDDVAETKLVATDLGAEAAIIEAR